MFKTRFAHVCSVLALLGTIGYGSVAFGGPREDEIRKELYLARQALAKTYWEINAIDRQVEILVEAIAAYEEYYNKTADPTVLARIAEARAELWNLMQEKSRLEVRVRELKGRIRELQRMLDGTTKTPQRDIETGASIG